MKYCWSAIVIVAIGIGLPGCSRETVKEITEGTVKTTKDTMKGVQEGLESGRQESESLDGAVIIGSLEDLQDKGSFGVGEVTQQADGSFIVELIVENTTDKPLRIIDLTETGALVLLDAEGFAAPLYDAKEVAFIGPNPSTITVLPQAKQRFKYQFAGDIKQPARLRVLGQEQAIKPPQPPAPDAGD